MCWPAPTTWRATDGSAVSPHQKQTWATDAALIFEDEATFRQDATLYRTWARRGCPPKIPTTGEPEIFQATMAAGRDPR